MQQRIAYIAYILAFTLTPVGVLAETVITNTVSASANSGGNVVTGGEVVEGESTSEVHTSTTINGETYETYERGTSSAAVEQTVVADDGEVSVQSSAAVETGGNVIQPTAVSSEVSASGTVGVETSSTDASTTVAAEATAETAGEENVLTWIAQTFRNVWSYVVTIF